MVLARTEKVGSQGTNAQIAVRLAVNHFRHMYPAPSMHAEGHRSAKRSRIPRCLSGLPTANHNRSIMIAPRTELSNKHISAVQETDHGKTYITHIPLQSPRYHIRQTRGKLLTQLGGECGFSASPGPFRWPGGSLRAVFELGCSSPETGTTNVRCTARQQLSLIQTGCVLEQLCEVIQTNRHVWAVRAECLFVDFERPAHLGRWVRDCRGRCFRTVWLARV